MCAIYNIVNTAARMESNGIKNKIHISESTYNELMSHGKEGYAVAREEKVRGILFICGCFLVKYRIIPLQPVLPTPNGKSLFCFVLSLKIFAKGKGDLQTYFLTMNFLNRTQPSQTTASSRRSNVSSSNRSQRDLSELDAVVGNLDSDTEP